jgi:hypothetical protein
MKKNFEPDNRISNFNNKYQSMKTSEININVTLRFMKNPYLI